MNRNQRRELINMRQAIAYNLLCVVVKAGSWAIAAGLVASAVVVWVVILL
jgi:hypothetical protein